MTTVLRTEDPAVAAAMGRCLLARSLRSGAQSFRPTQRHPRECGWCDYPIEVLQAALIEFNTWAEYDDRRSTSGRHPTRTFAELARDEQERLITVAQALVDAKAPAPADAPAETVQEDEISWLR